MKHFDTFTGYGGFTISAQKLGWETIGFSEIDKYASAVLEYNFSGIKNYGNISDIDFRQFNGEVDIITGGSPCQDLSVAGKRAGLEGGRSGLFFEFIRAITESNPKYFVWENVKGALSSSKGWDFARVQIEMEQAGYDVQWQVINAKDFGVPQNRERIFAIGIRKGSGREILFERVSSSQDNKTQQQVSSTIHAGYYKQGGRDQQYVPNKIVNTGHTDTSGTGLYAVRPSGDIDKRKYSFKSESGTLSSNPTSDNLPMVAIPNSNGNIHSLDANYWKGSNNPNKSRRSQIAIRCKGWNGEYKGVKKDIFSTVGTTVGNKTLGSGRPLVGEDMRIRRLTPLECERLMGLEDNWTAKGIIDGKTVDISDTQRYKMCGNGVVVNCVDYIYKLIN